MPSLPSLTNLPFLSNHPAWSLFDDILASLAFALLMPKIGLRLLVVVVAVSGMAELNVLNQGYEIDQIGVLYGTLLAGMIRTAFPFFAGVLIHRLHQMNKLPSFSPGFPVLSILLFLTFVPNADVISDFGTEFKSWDTIYFIVIVSVVYPLIIMMGAADRPNGRIAKAAEFSGAISFPAYILHDPLYFWFAVVAAHFGFLDDHPSSAYFLLSVLTVLSASYLTLKYYDEPVRRWLLKTSRNPKPISAITPNSHD